MDDGLWKRGAFLLGLMVVLAGIMWYFWPRRPTQGLPVEPPGNVQASPAGWEIRYEATATLARKGSKEVRINVLREMLDENIQLKNSRAKLADGKEVPNETTARLNVINAMKAVVDWHKKPEAIKAAAAAHPEELKGVYAAIDRLAQSSNLVVRTEAERTRKAISNMQKRK